MNLERLRKLFPKRSVPRKKADARVEIAKDVIETLDAQRMVATPLEYFKLGTHTEGALESFEATALSVRRKGKTKCRVCALGATVVCAVGLYDEAPELEEDWGYKHVSNSTMRDVLSRWFSRQQLDLIECAFEMCSGFDLGKSSNASRETAETFGEGFSHPRARLVAIMQNIVDNKGLFRP